MNGQELLATLALRLNIELPLENNSCSVIFDNDAVDFQLVDESLFLFAKLGDANNRHDAYERLLCANFAGQQSGGAVISIDDNAFILHTLFCGDCEYPHFEAALARFVKALRYWKEWIALPAVAPSSAEIVNGIRV